VIRRLAYRARQFFTALVAPLAVEDFQQAQRILTPAQWELFRRMSSSDRRHGLAVCRALQAQGPQPADLLVAALLHDVGKAAVSSAIWVRVATVLLERLAPRWLERDPPPNWMRAVVNYRQHAERGAEWAARAGCSSITVDLIRRHEMPADAVDSELDPLLVRLQVADDSW
jgi:hypothetical protein